MGPWIGAIAGAGVALAGDLAATRLNPGGRTPVAAVGLGGAAAIYPLARSRRRLDAHLARELAALAGYGAVAWLAARREDPLARRLLAAAWSAHALFDLAHDRGEDSLIPDWYPAACAGYDLALAARLVAVD